MDCVSPTESTYSSPADPTKGVSFYIAHSKQFLKTQQVVELTGSGTSINTIVCVASMLSDQGLVTIEKIHTSLEYDSEEDTLKAKIEIWLEKTDAFFDKMALEELEKEEERKEKKKSRRSKRNG
ncbi:hypothetical protein AKO1_014155 [Acrasis kona]|uniref:DNA/RNA-binding protein Alba-like domain-containing protein n=1 Tax=Acrasis kona TaxID=1008807 RepID=A0AAW2Z0S5_9EUKA